MQLPAYWLPRPAPPPDRETTAAFDRRLDQPGDFPFLEQIHGHDDDLLRVRMAVDPAGFPWFEEP